MKSNQGIIDDKEMAARRRFWNKKGLFRRTYKETTRAGFKETTRAGFNENAETS